MNRLVSALGGRRFVMTMGCGFACTALVWFGKISGGEFVTVICATVAAYIAGGSAQHIFGGKEKE